MAARARLVVSLVLGCLGLSVGAALAVPASAAPPGTLVWRQTWGPTSLPQVSGARVAVAGTGDVYVAAAIDRGVGHGRDWVIVRYTPAGVRKWVRYVDGAAHQDDFLSAVAADRYGDVVVCGRLIDASATGYDYATARFSRAGKLLWTRRVRGSGNGYDSASDLLLDGRGNVYVTGSVVRTATQSDWLTVKYSPAGKRVWRQYFDGGLKLADSANALARDAGGNLYVAGSARVDPGANEDICLVRYAPSGHADWARHGNWVGGWTDRGLDVATNGRIVAVAGISASGVLQYGEVYVVTTAGRVMTWLTEGQFLPPGGLVSYSSVSMGDAGDILAGGFVQTALVSGPDFFCGYYQPFGGTHLLTKTGDTDGWDLCNTVLVTPDGTAYAAGSIANATTGQDVFIQAIDPGWHSRFERTYSATGQPTSNDQATGLAFRGGYLYVAGASAGRLLLLKYVR